MILNFIGLFILLSGFIIGLGSVTVIDIHGFLGRKSRYWTEATTRTHKVTKPLIWLGIILAIVGGMIFFRNENFLGTVAYLVTIAGILIINGTFLSFKVSPFLLAREAAGNSDKLLPQSWQRKIIASFITSFIGWWGALCLVVWHIISNNSLL